MGRESVTLYYREGASDKVYQASIEEKDGGYVVNFAFGRRGATLNTGTKTASPVPLAKAKAIFDKLILEKKGKGYTPGEDGTPYQHTDVQQRATGLHCQLLNAAADGELDGLLDDAGFWAQEKKDGKRVLVRHESGVITGVNRRGLSIGLPRPIETAALALGAKRGDFTLDGECIGEMLFAFDVLSAEGKDRRDEPYAARLEVLTSLLAGGGALEAVATARSASEKRGLVQTLKAQRKEGVVFKQHAALYKAGRPSSGGSQVKVKFYATASVLVSKINAAKRSVALEVISDGKKVSVGNVTVPPNTTIPSAGTIVEIRYLYAYPGGSLYQPVLLGARTDLEASACTLGQLKLRAADEDDDA